MQHKKHRLLIGNRRITIESLEGRVLLSSAVDPVLSSPLMVLEARAASHQELAPAVKQMSAAVAATLPAPGTPVLAAATDSGVKGDNITNITKPTFTGTAVAGARVTIYSGATPVGSNLASAKGVWSVTSNVALSNGLHLITAAANKSGVTSSASAALHLTIQTTLPAAPTKLSIVSFATLTPTFTGAAPTGDTVTIYADSKAVGSAVAKAGAFSITVSALAAGAHSIYATATDVAGNISAKSATLKITLTQPAEIKYSYVTTQSTYDVQPGATVTIDIYLKETLIGGAKSLIIADGGLLGAGFSVTRAGALPKTPAALTAIAGSITTNGSNFAGGIFATKSGGSASSMAAAELTSLSAVAGPMPNAKDSSGITDLIELGSITIVAGAAGTTQFTLADRSFPATSGGWTLTNDNGFDLDLTQTSGAHPYIGASNAPDVFDVTVN